jgi:hypothetical protein
MNIKERVLPLADAYATQMIHSHYRPLMESRAALCAALDAADREIERLKSKAEMFEVAFLQMRTALGLDLHSHDNLVDVARELKAENAKLRLDAERYRAVRKATITEDDAFLDELDNHEAPKTEAEFDAIFDAARAAIGHPHD